jgi:hypothetical protein
MSIDDRSFLAVTFARVIFEGHFFLVRDAEITAAVTWMSSNTR